MSRLLNKVNPKTIEEQVSELDQLSMDALNVIATSEESDILRAAAITHLDYGASLSDLALTCAIPSLQQQARQRIAELIDSDIISLKQLTTDGMDIMAQFSVVGFCQRTDLLPQLLNLRTDADFFYKIAIEGVSARLRELAVAKIDDHEKLKQLLKDTKGKDKLVYNIVKEKCDAFREKEKQAENTQAEIEALCEKVEIHSKRVFDKQYTGKANRLTDQWQLLESQSNKGIKLRAQQAIFDCQKTIEADTKQRADQAAREASVDSAAKTLHDIITELSLCLTQLYEIDGTDEQCKAIELANTDCQQRHSDALKLVPASPDNEKTFTQLNESIAFQLQQLAKHGSLNAHAALLTKPQTSEDKVSNENKSPQHERLYGELKTRLQSVKLLPATMIPQAVKDVKVLMTNKEKYWADQKQAVTNQLRHINALIGKANSALKAGESRQAAGIRRSLDKNLLELAKIPASVATQLEQLDWALKKLLDWKNYAVEPKQQQLIDDMRALTESEENSEALATKIQRLQHEWKALSKGTQDQEQWESFHKLAEQAYQPCKEYFAAQSEIRRANLDKRRNLVTQLTEYFDTLNWEDEASESIDWSFFEKLIGAAIREWQTYAPTDRKTNKSVQRNFDRMLNTMRRKLSQQQQKNSQAKQKLIKQVTELLDLPDNRNAIEKVKGLQAQWKKSGRASHKEDQKLWQAFRVGCDAIFEKRQQQAKEFKVELQEHKAQAQALLVELGNSAKLTGQALLDVRTRVIECQKEFRMVGNLPKIAATALNEKFYNAIKQFDAAVVQQLKADKTQVWVNLLKAADKIRLSQLAKKDQERVDLQQQAKDFMDSVTQWPKNGLAVLEGKIALSSSVDAQQQSEYEKTLKILCIRAEILTDRDTPAEDKELRMQYQVSRLQQGFGQNTSTSGVNIQDLTLEWVAVGPVPTKIYHQLLKRFQKCS
jgi:hypothetical protein